jgi:hypothetical protein
MMSVTYVGENLNTLSFLLEEIRAGLITCRREKKQNSDGRKQSKACIMDEKKNSLETLLPDLI